MKPFNLDEYLKNSNRKIITHDGCIARIIFTNGIHPTHPIVALVSEEAGEIVYQYDSQGKCYLNGNGPHDLFFLEKKEGWICIYKYKKGTKDAYVTEKIYNSEDEAIAGDLRRGNNIDIIKIE